MTNLQNKAISFINFQQPANIREFWPLTVFAVKECPTQQVNEDGKDGDKLNVSRHKTRDWLKNVGELCASWHEAER